MPICFYLMFWFIFQRPRSDDPLAVEPSHYQSQSWALFRALLLLVMYDGRLGEAGTC